MWPDVRDAVSYNDLAVAQVDMTVEREAEGRLALAGRAVHDHGLAALDWDDERHEDGLGHANVCGLRRRLVPNLHRLVPRVLNSILS